MSRTLVLRSKFTSPESDSMRMLLTLAPPRSPSLVCRWPSTPVMVMPSTDSMSMEPPEAVSSAPPEMYFNDLSSCFSTKSSCTQTPIFEVSMPARTVMLSWAVTRPPMLIMERERSSMSEPTSTVLTAPRSKMSPSETMLSWPSASRSLLPAVTAAVPALESAAAASVPV